MQLNDVAETRPPIVAADAYAYSTREVARLIGIRTERARQWLVGRNVTQGPRQYRQKPLVLRHRKVAYCYASFRELVHLMVVKKFLDSGISHQMIRESLNEMCERLSIPHFAHEAFLTSAFYGDGKYIYWDINGNKESCSVFMQLGAGGQLAISRVIEMFAERIVFDDVGLASRWYPDEGRLIVLDPEVSFGSPTIAGRRVTTSSVYGFFNGESGNIRATCDWFDLTREQVEAAVMFEGSFA